MKLKFITLLVFLSVQIVIYSQSITSLDYGFDIETVENNTVQVYCGGGATPAVSVTLPAGGPWVVTSVDVVYSMTAANGAWMSEQFSSLFCVNSGLSELQVTGGGTNNEGTFGYNRPGLNIANGVYNGGDVLTFNMLLSRDWSGGLGTGCMTDYNKLDNDTWQVTVNYELAVPMTYIGSTTSHPVLNNIENCATTANLLKIEIETTGTIIPLNVSTFNLSTTGTTNVGEINAVNVYYTGNSNSFSDGNLFGTAGSGVAVTGSQDLVEGMNYFWVEYGLTPTLTNGNTFDCVCTTIDIQSNLEIPIDATPNVSRTVSGCNPAPGGLGITNLSAWFKAGDVTAGDLTTWSTSYPIGGASVVLTDGSAPYAQISETPVNDIFNYHSAADFDGNSSANQKMISNNNALNLLTNQNVGAEGTFVTVFSRASIPVNDDGIVTYKDGQDGIQLRSWGRLALGDNNSTNGTRNFTINPVLHPCIMGYSGNKSTATSMFGVQNDLEITNSSASCALMNQGLTFGAKRNNATTFNEYFDGFISEVIFFNTTLNVADLNKVNSYLGIKYGITLENTGGGIQGDYVSPSGNLIWDASLSDTYHNDVIGIGKGLNQALEQKQSHSLDDSLRIYVSTLQTTNSLNTGSIVNDDSYVVVGNNEGTVCATAASVLEMPAGCALYSRLEREWKLTKTNFDQTFSLDIKLNNCANTGLVDPAHLRLLVDDDGDFSNGGTSCYMNGDGTGIVISYSGPVITVSNLSSTHFANSDTRYFTIGSILSNTPLPITLTSFTVNCSLEGSNNIAWETKSEMNNDYFTVEKSYDGLNWTYLSELDGNGSSSTLLHYEVSDIERMEDAVYYRLKQTDFDGTTTIVGQTKVECENNKPTIYPNPFNDELFINFKTEGKYLVIVRDILGRVIYNEEFIEINSNVQYLDLSQVLSTGMYYVSILQNEKTILLNEKIVKN